MDSHKLFWHLDEVEAWQRGERVAPLHIDIGISSDATWHAHSVTE